MKALVFKGPEKIFLEEIEKPIPKENELLVKIKAVGIIRIFRVMLQLIKIESGNQIS